jgi:hypothetical protein
MVIIRRLKNANFRHALELHSMLEVEQFSIEIFENPDDDHIGRNVQCTSDVKNNLIFIKREL